LTAKKLAKAICPSVASIYWLAKSTAIILDLKNHGNEPQQKNENGARLFFTLIPLEIK